MKTNEFDRRNNHESSGQGLARRTSARQILTGVALTSGLATLAWVMDAPPVRWISNTVAAASKPKAAATNEANESPTAEKKIKLNYFSASWPRVLQDLAATGDMDVVADRYPVGRFSRMDRTEYGRKEAIRIVNQELEQLGFRIMEKGQYLVLIELKGDRHDYQRAVLPRKSKAPPIDEVEEAITPPRGFRADSMTSPRREPVNSAVYTEDVADKSIRYTNKPRRTAGDSDADNERIPSTRKWAPARSVKQTAHEEMDERSEIESPSRPRRLDPSAPAALPDSDDAASAVYRPRKLSALEISKRVYRAMKSSSELIDAGRDGLPAVSIVSPQLNSPNPATQESGSSRSVEFMISIDEVRNELLIDGQQRDAAAALKLLRALDSADEASSRTVVKPGSNYVCQIADQLPAEIERIRAARASDVSRHPAESRKVESVAQRQRRGPAQMETEDPVADDQAEETEDPSMSKALGNFKGEVNIESIPDLNVIVIRGNARDVEEILKVIRQIEKLSEATAPQVHLLHLKNVDSESLAELMTSIYEKLTRFPGKATQPRESVAIIAVSKPNALLIVAPQADLDSILDLAEELDKPVDPQTEFQVFRLKSAIAAELEVTITELYKEPKSLGTKVLVIADPRANALIVRARPRDLDEIKALIAKMDRDGSDTINQVRVFRLKNAVATELAAVINASIQSVLSPPTSTAGGGGGLGGQGGNAGLGGGQVDEQFKSVKSTVLKFMSVQNGTTQQLKSGILSDIRVTPDAHANSLIVTATEKSMDLIAALIQALDRPTSTVSEIKVFTLENADAAQMVQQLNALFNPSAQQGGAGGNLRQQLGIAIANADDASSSLVPMKFSVDTRTNSVIAVGSADALKVVEAILLRLDESNLRSRKNMVVRLNNAPAAQIATAVAQFFQQQRDLAQVDPNLVSNVEQLEREVIVVPDTISNNLLISSTPRYFPDILTMVKTLDAQPKQVVIQALIVEVQLNNTDEFGIEMGLQSPVLFDRSLKQPPVVQTTTNTTGQLQTTSQTLLSEEGSPGFNFNNPGVPLGNNVLASAATVGGQSLTNFSLGRTNGQLGYGGLVLSAGSNSVNALLRALASKTKINILSRPQIRALDSLPSEVFVGQTIPTVTSFNTNATTGVISPILTQRDTGIGMQVTPRINQDGNVVINLYAFRSQLSQQTVSVTTDSRGQPVGQRITDLSNVRTTVLVPSNSTIVIGGMISTRDETTARKAPFLGDVPVLGQLFRYDSRSTIRTELLIFLTPRIISGADEEECFKDIEMGRLHFIESEAESVHGPLRALPPPEDVFEDGQATPWIGPGVPTVPPSPTQPAPLDSMPLPPSPIQLPPSPATEQPAEVPARPVTPPPPPLPDANLTRINAIRAMNIEQDSPGRDSVTTANWTATPNARKRAAALKKSVEGQK